MSSLTSWLGSADRRVLALVAALLLIAVAGATVGGVYAYQQSVPTTTSFNLSSGQKEVALDQGLTATFSRPVAPDVAAAHFHITPTSEGRLEPSADHRSFTWTRVGPWSDLTDYTVAVDSFQYAGHRVRGRTLHFTTTIVPRVTRVTTDAGAGIADGADLPVGAKLVLAFNAAMDQPSVELDGNGAAVALSWGADGTSAVLDTQGMKIGQLQLAFAHGKDRTGHAMSSSWKLGVNLVFRINVHTTPLKFPALVQVPNDPSARDQSGLQAADMVFEYATEGNIPRFTAVFTRIPDKVGPVRSGRLISIKLTQHYRGELFLSGTSQGTFGVLRASGIPALFDSAGYYYRSFDRPAPNNLYINGDAIARAESQTDLGPLKLPTGKPVLTGGTPAAQAQVAQNGSTYAYDGATNTYTKVEAGHTFSDASIGQPLRISMVIVMHTRVSVTGIIEDSNNAHGLDYDLDSGGSAEIYYGGLRSDGRWSSPGAGAPLVFTLAAGQQLALPAGLVWIDVVP